MPLGVDWSVQGGTELRRISKELRTMGDGKEIKKRFSRDLRAAAAPLVPAVRSAIAAIPATSGDHTGLRTEMARATGLTVRTTGRQASVSIQVDGRKMPSGRKALQAYMEGLKRPWRHPVFGNRDVWVTQQPHPYFFRTVRPLGVASRIVVNRTISKITRDIS